MALTPELLRYRLFFCSVLKFILIRKESGGIIVIPRAVYMGS